MKAVLNRQFTNLVKQVDLIWQNRLQIMMDKDRNIYANRSNPLERFKYKFSVRVEDALYDSIDALEHFNSKKQLLVFILTMPELDFYTNFVNKFEE